MSLVYPSALDYFTFKRYRSPISYQNYNDIQNAIEILEAKVGVNNSSVESSIEYKTNDYTSTIVGAESDISNMNSNKQARLGSLGFYFYHTSGIWFRRISGEPLSWDSSDGGFLIKSASLAGTPTGALVGYVVSAPSDIWFDQDIVVSSSSSGVYVYFGTYVSSGFSWRDQIIDDGPRKVTMYVVYTY